LYSLTVKFTGLTVLGSFTGQLLSGHRCWCTLDEEHHFIQCSYWPTSYIADRSSHTLPEGCFFLIRRTSVNEFSFLLKLPTLTVCRQSVQISTALELLSTALNCRIYTASAAACDKTPALPPNLIIQWNEEG